jgi:hypothetical protein
MTAAHELDELVEAMLPAATEIAVCVRDRDVPGVHAALGPVLDADDRDRTAALIVALAVMVPDDVSFGDLVAWTHGQDQLPLGELALDGSEKYCRGCQQVKHRRNFSIDRSRKDGLFLRCKACVSREDRDRRARKAQERGRREAAA